MRTICAVLALAFLFGPVGPVGSVDAAPAESLLELIERHDSAPCRECHRDVHDQWARSQHARPLLGIKDLFFLKNVLKSGQFTVKDGDPGGKRNLGCLMACHLPQLADAEENVAREIIRAVQNDDRELIGRLTIGCPVCHGVKGLVRGTADPNVLYGSRDIPDHPGKPIIRSPALKDSSHCGQCHGTGPVFNEGMPMQCATLYGSYLHAYVPAGGTQTCQNCHVRKGDHVMAPVWAERAEVASGYATAIPLEAEGTLFFYRRHEYDKALKAVVEVRLGNTAGHRLPDGWPSDAAVVLEATISDVNGKELGKTKRTFMPQAGDGLGERMRLGAENKLGLLRDSSLQPLAIRREHLEFELPPDVKEAACRLTVRYELRPDNAYVLHDRELKLSLRE